MGPNMVPHNTCGFTPSTELTLVGLYRVSSSTLQISTSECLTAPCFPLFLIDTFQIIYSMLIFPTLLIVSLWPDQLKHVFSLQDIIG